METKRFSTEEKSHGRNNDHIVHCYKQLERKEEEFHEESYFLCNK
jgi:hypothetical protein